MAPEPVEIALARLDERTKGTADDVAEIKLNMATKTDQAHIDERIINLTGALEKESAERKASVEKETHDRKADVKSVRDRLQVVEDRQEQRKYHTLISILLAGVSCLFTVASGIAVAVILSTLGGGAP